MKFQVRFIFFLCLILSLGQGNAKAHSLQYHIFRASFKAPQDSPRTDHCRIKEVIVTTSPFRKEKEHNEIEIFTKENRVEDENEEDDDDERASVKKNNYFTTFFYSQTPVYFSGCNEQYFTFCKGSFYSAAPRHIAFRVFRV